MMALGPKKKNILFIAAGAAALPILVCLFLDIMMNQGGRLILIGALVGVIAAAVTLLAGGFFKKENAEKTERDVNSEERFKRKRKNSEEEFSFVESDAQDSDAGSKFMRDTDVTAVAEDSFDAFDVFGEQPVQGTRGADMSVPPSEQLKQRGFFGKRGSKKEESEEAQPVEAAPVQQEDDWQQTGFDGFENDGFEAPVLAFGDPSDNAVSPTQLFEMHDDVQEQPQEFEGADFESEQPPVEPEFDDFAQQPDFEQPEFAVNEPMQEAVTEDIPVQPVQEESEPVFEQPVAAETIVQPKENVLLKDIEPGMVVASAAPGQTIDSFFDGMSEEDIAYRDCVEVWASGAKNPMMKLLKYVDDIEDKKTAGLIGRECEYVNAMIDRMLYFSQLDMIDQALNMQEYNFSVLVKTCLKRFSPFFMEKKIGLLWKGLDVNVITDKRWFIFALTQVIFNSVEFTPQGGKIAISAKKTDDYIDLVIDDSGEGIDHEELPYVFTAGFMGDDAPNPDETRTGMGLFITRTVLQKLGGECMAESTKGKGTRIVMRLPAMKEEQTSQEA